LETATLQLPSGSEITRKNIWPKPVRIHVYKIHDHYVAFYVYSCVIFFFKSKFNYLNVSVVSGSFGFCITKIMNQSTVGFFVFLLMCTIVQLYFKQCRPWSDNS